MAPKKAKPKKLSGADLQDFLTPSKYGVPAPTKKPGGTKAVAKASQSSASPCIPTPTTKCRHYSGAVSFLPPRRTIEPLLVCGKWTGIAAEWDALPAAARRGGAKLAGIAAEQRPPAVLELVASGATAFPILVQSLSQILEKVGDASDVIKASAAQAADAILQALSPYGARVALPALVNALRPLGKAEELEFALFMLEVLARLHPAQMAWSLQDAVAATIPLMTHLKAPVWKAAVSTMTALCDASGNRDIQPEVASILRCIRVGDSVCESIERLASVVFLQPVETPALALMAPVLVRGLKSRKPATQRRACTIAGNMVQMVPDMRELRSFVPQLLPLLEKAQEEISDPEVRSVAVRVYQTLKSAEALTGGSADPKLVLAELRHGSDLPLELAEYAASLSCSMASCRCFEAAVWRQEFALLGLSMESADRLMGFLFVALRPEEEDEDPSSPDDRELCDCTFTLGYGNLALLTGARLCLKERKVYGLLGPNGCGKTTLMRAISDGKLEGFPPKSELRCAFMEHGGIGESEPECDMLPQEYILSSELVRTEKKSGRVTKALVREELERVGFRNGIELDSTLGCLSAGWKVKVGLVCAMLSRADILLLDEPTNHLDVANAAWLAEYICGLRQQERPVTVVMNSHDSLFLERTTTHIITYDGMKLVTRQGRLTEIVSKHPSAMNFFVLKAGKFQFKFPDPGFLAPIPGEAATTSRGRFLLRMSDVHFTYPEADREILHGVSVKVSMLSRVAILGSNGTGKSTMVKCLLGELTPSSGQVWKHAGARIAYVAQHAFGHLEQQLDKTPTRYILDRFAGNEDSESLEHRSRLGETATEPVEKIKMRLVDGKLVSCGAKGKAVVLEQVLGRRKCSAKRKGLEYEVRWVGRPEGETMWVHSEELDHMGYKRERQRLDEATTQATSLWKKELATGAVEAHLGNFSLPAELASHTRIRNLSGGQKVKVVLAAAMWLDPHVVVLDEPTNYLDADALGALTQAIEDFKGGVLVISHNTEFCERVASEQWCIREGLVHAEGGDYVDADANAASESSEGSVEFEDEREKALHTLEKKLRSDKRRGLLCEDERRRLEDRIEKLKARLSADG